MENNKNTDETKAVKRTERPGVLLNYAAIFAAIIVILAALRCARGILGPFFLAAFFTVLLISPVNWLKKRGFKSWAALTIVIIAVAVVGLSGMTIVGAQVAQFARNIPDYRDRFTETLESYNLDLGVIVPALRTEKPQELDVEEEEPGSEQKVESEEESAKKAYFQRLRWRDEYEQEKLENQGRRSRRSDAKTTDSTDNRLFDGANKTTYLAPAVVPVVARRDSDAPDGAEASLIDEPTATGAADGVSSGLIPEDPPQYMLQTSPQADESASSVDSDDETAFDSDDDPDDDLFLARFPLGVDSVSAVDASSQELFRFLGGLAGELSTLLSNAFLITLLVIFMLCETEKLPKKLLATWGQVRFANSHIKGVVVDIRNYMIIKTLMSALVGVLVVTLCFFSRVQYPLLWGFVAFLLNYIPTIGSVAAAIPPVVLATIDHGLFVGCVDAGAFVLINCLVGYALEPRLLGDGLDLSPLIVLIALIFFGWLLGPVGMFLSPPLAVVMKIIFQSFPETEWIAALMANRVQKSIDEEEVSAEA
ncbi:MAG: AI-2E family transporter [Thermoguttaceae bacterium]|nr:AI-2E family transporter [Thermoguttaceae bacterium]